MPESAAAENPFYNPSSLPYGLPPFAEIREEHYRSAFERGFSEQLAEIAEIVSNPEPPTFENTMIPLEQSGQLLQRVAEVLSNLASADSSNFTQELDEEMAPRLAAHQDAITLNPELFSRIVALHDLPASNELDDEARYLIERYFIEFTMAGAGLNDADKQRLRDLNSRLSQLTTRFEKNLLADTNDSAVIVEDRAELAGLDEGAISAASESASERGHDGGYAITLVLPTGHPFLADLRERHVRERIMRASTLRGRHGGANDNRELVLEITRLRAKRARLLGFADHASYVTADETARTPEAVADMLGRLAPAAARNARAEHARLQDIAGAGSEVASWDWAFYTEQVRRMDFDVDTAAMRPYFEAERVLRDGVFFAANRLYGISFHERPDLVGYHPDVRVFEVSNEDGSPLGLYLLDLYTRDSKRGGAWMNSLVSQSTLLGTSTVVVNNLNVPKPASDLPTLLTYDETTTLFHEFGHALHGLFAHVVYPKFAGTNVFRDFVEFPSQVNEMWALWPEVLENYARHVDSGEPMPQTLVDRLRASTTFNEGFKTSEYLAAAMLDQAWHRISADEHVDDVETFEAEALRAAGLDDPAVPPRYSSTYFSHVFAGGYDAGYYSYIWSEVLDADTVEWFTENDGLTRANGDRFRQRLLGVGGSKDPLKAYRDFRGRDAVIEPLLKRRGLES